jgi:hypothetical protein
MTKRTHLAGVAAAVALLVPATAGAGVIGAAAPAVPQASTASTARTIHVEVIEYPVLIGVIAQTLMALVPR